MRRTKIVCTIGPASDSPAVLRKLVHAGMNVARLNFSHGSQAEHLTWIRNIREVAKELEVPIAILQDLAGPKIRTGPIAAGTVTLKPNVLFTLTSRAVPGDEREVSTTYPKLAQEVEVGSRLLLADGAIELKVVAVSGRDIRCKVVVAGELSSHKGINLPHGTLSVSAVTEKDEADLEFGLERGVDFVAMSFVRRAEDILKARRIMKRKGVIVPIIAKIEKHEALENIDAIVAAADGIMVARGDLAVETALERVPLVQKMLIHKCNAVGKPVITATQMLKSMVDNPRPTRAEAADVANAVLDGTDAVMLSEETTIGKYPVEAVKMMSRIVEATECEFPFERAMGQNHGYCKETIPDAVSHAACLMAQELGATAILTPTQSGSTARLIARCRPKASVIAVTPNTQTLRQLSLSWGVQTFLVEPLQSTDDMIAKAEAAALNSGLVKKGDTVVITAGIPPGVPGSTNLIKAEVIG